MGYLSHCCPFSKRHLLLPRKSLEEEGNEDPDRLKYPSKLLRSYETKINTS